VATSKCITGEFFFGISDFMMVALFSFLSF